MPASQAGRRGFESRLPLQKSITYRPSDEKVYCDYCNNGSGHDSNDWTQFGSSTLNHRLQLPASFDFRGQIRDRILVLADINVVPHLVRAGLCINARFPAQSGVSATQHLEARPAELCFREGRLNVP